MMQTGKGFTLIELLIVIAILAVLATTVVLVLNPAELLAQARDSQRFSDLAAVQSAVSLYIASETSPTVGNGAIWCTVSGNNWNASTACATITTSTAVNGTGWVNVDLTQIDGGSPLGKLPIDPNNGSSACGGGTKPCFYGFRGDNTNKTFKIETVLESVKYKTDKMTNDGGSSATVYEIGSDLAL